MKLKICVFILMYLFVSPSYSQEFQHGNLNFWFLNLNRFQLFEKWSFTNEIHERTGNKFSHQGQFLLRPSFDFQLNKNTEVSLGYSYIHIWPYSPYILTVQKIENNLWEQLLFKMEFGKCKIQNRFRQENRWYDHFTNLNGGLVKSGVDYGNRFRFRFTALRDLIELESKHTIFFNIWNEIWIFQDKHLRPIDFARNWLYLGIGYRFNDQLNVQIGYINQLDKVNSVSFIQSDIVQLTLQRNFSLVKLKFTP